MRRIVLLFIIALLPLRLWAVEGMATAMALGSVHASASSAPATTFAVPWLSSVQVFTSLPPEPVGSMPDDCPMMSSDQDSKPTSMGAASGSAHCPACHMGATAPSSVDIPPVNVFLNVAPPSSAAAHFQSAEPRLARKPPIS